MFPTGRDYEQMAMNTRAGLLVHEAASKNILWANPAACRMFGFTVEELRPLKAHHMSGREKQYRRVLGVAWLQEAVTNGQSHRRWKYRAKSGHEFLTDATATLVQFDDGPVVVVEFRPIDEEVELEEDLKRTTGYLQRIMTYASAGVLLLNDQNQIQDISAFAARLFRRPALAMIGRSPAEFAEITPPLGAVADRLGNMADPIELRMCVRGGESPTWLRGQIENVVHDGIDSRILVVRDITSKVELEQQNAYQEANLQYLSRYHAMGDMAMIIAHELGQPLAAATNFLSGIQSRLETGTLTDQDIRYGLERARKELARSSSIVSSVKRYVQRIESNAELRELNAIVTDSLYFVRLRAAERNVRVESEPVGDPLPVTGDHVLLGQVILNFCFNAIDEAVASGTPDRRIRITTGAEDGYATCSVHDWGRGLDRVQGERLLESAFSDKKDGSGIGLILSERIISRHNGEIVIRPNRPTGTVLTMRLPLAAQGL
ncbi:PAS domain S-box-containing protein [Raineyella antarctica]|uniref:histidine kinase n=1 Tax=Raineyella antarctica TaxID=1577474 RepID=A0A1G6GJ07_9ACTN|nr:PAS domain-containing sensor histidine kinase [Raineyella antarctica]SDB81924.1 PAS domain S-box-containing protein [Raineyella antarctica]